MATHRNNPHPKIQPFKPLVLEWEKEDDDSGESGASGGSSSSGWIGLPELNESEIVAINNELQKALREFGESQKDEFRQKKSPAEQAGEFIDHFERKVHPTHNDPRLSAINDSNISVNPAVSEREALIELQNQLELQKRKQLGLVAGTAPTLSIPGR